MYKVRIMIGIFQGMPRKYQDLIHLWRDSLYVSAHFSTVGGAYFSVNIKYIG